MKRTIIAAAIAALTVPVVAAAPAQASQTIHVRVDPRDWAWSGTITYGCDEPTSVPFSVRANSGLQLVFDFTIREFDECNQPMLSASTLTDKDGNTYSGQSTGANIELYLADGWTMDPFAGEGKGQVAIMFMFGDLDDGWELKMFPSVFASAIQPGTVKAAADVNTGDARSTNAGHITLNPNRVTAMAQRFVDAPGDLINIHGYGPDRDKALSRANHVRDHLLAEITRLGGDADAYPVMVLYGGDPDHKKNTHVTIHQHAASNITVPEGGSPTIGDIGTGGWRP